MACNDLTHWADFEHVVELFTIRLLMIQKPVMLHEGKYDEILVTASMASLAECVESRFD
jgi:hypothetical protein